MAKTLTSSGQGISAKVLSEISGESYNTIDHWSNQELLLFRRRGRTRLYDKQKNLERCRHIRKFQEEGHSLTTIRRFLNATTKEV